MVTQDGCLTRGSIEEIAGSLQQLIHMATEGHQRRQLAECAARLQAVARTIRTERLAPICRRDAVVPVLRRAAEALDPMQRSSLALLGLLLASPGESVSSRTLAAMIGISPQSVRVFAFHLRRWLADAGYPDALRSQWGLGYLIPPGPAVALLARWPVLEQLAQAIAVTESATVRQAA